MNTKRGIVSADELNMRAAPATDKPVVAKLRKGSEVEILDRVGSWYRVSTDQGSGYVHSDYVDVDGGAPLDVSETLPGFRGDVAWIHRWEGHAGKPYWPGGESGVTLDPGLDLGHANAELVDQAYRERLSPEQYAAVRKVLGIRGERASAALGGDAVLKGIRTSRQTATLIFPHVSRPYWKGLCERFPALAGPDTPGEVHTAMLSIGYNRGPRNRALESLKEPIARGDWARVGELIGAMQQDHPLEGIRKRRRSESELILSALA